MAELIGVTHKPTPTLELIRLELTYEEAKALSAVCSHVGGDPASTRRVFIDRILHVLEAAGVSNQPIRDINGTVMFEDCT